MKGKIKAYSACVSAGVIMSDCGKSYVFSKTEWKEPAPPADHVDVEFDGNAPQAANVKLCRAG